MKTCDGVDTLSREESFNLLQVCDNMLDEGRITKVNPHCGLFLIMSTHHESILETIYDEICEEFPELDDDAKFELTRQRFEDQCQWNRITYNRCLWVQPRSYYHW